MVNIKVVKAGDYYDVSLEIGKIVAEYGMLRHDELQQLKYELKQSANYLELFMDQDE